MTSIQIPPAAQRVRRLRMRRDLAELDIRRGVLELRRENYSEQKIADMLAVSQPTVHNLIKVAERDPEPAEGQQWATPYEICQRYAAGEITREVLVEQLVQFPYVKGGKTDGFDDLIVDPPGTWAEVSRARSSGLIDMGIYEDVFNRRHGL